MNEVEKKKMSSQKEKEEAHNKFWYDMRNVSLEASAVVGKMHVLYMGVEYFATQCKVSAPNKEEAREMMIDVIDRVLEKDDEEEEDE